MSLDAKADRLLRCTLRVLVDDQFTKFGFERFVGGVLVFVLADVLRFLQVGRMHPQRSFAADGVELRFHLLGFVLSLSRFAFEQEAGHWFYQLQNKSKKHNIYSKLRKYDFNFSDAI